MIYKLILSVSIIFISVISFGQNTIEKPVTRGIHKTPIRLRSSQNTTNYDLKYLRFELKVNPSVKYIEGNVTSYFVPISNFSSIYFDFRNNMTVDSVKYHGDDVSYSFTGNEEFNVDFEQNLQAGVLDSLTIFYHGTPYEDGFGSFKVASTTCSNQDSVMWTLSEPYGAKNWWPCKETLIDKIDSVDMFVTTPVKYHTGSNGLLISRDTIDSGNKVTEHWKHKYPIPAYLIAYASSEYSIYKDTFDLYNGGQLEILNYVFPCDSATAHNNTKDLDTVMNFFIKKFGPYPYETEKYGHAQCRFGGGMEHTTMTFMGGWWYYILIHEMAHQWFGDKITCGSWHDIWLNEGFATYLEGLTCEEGIQSTSFHDWLNGKRNSVLSNNYGSVYCDDTTSVNRIFNSRLSYNKGAYLLHMLRWILGDDAFFQGMNEYINDSDLAYDYAKTPDFKAHMETAGDTSLDEFFNDWFYNEGWPDYTFRWSVDTACNNKLRIKITQSHSANQGVFFEMPVPIKFSDGTNDTIFVFHQNSPDDTIFFEFPDFKPTTLEFDPDLWLIAKNTTTIKENSPPIKTIHWTGSENNYWHIEDNWDCGVPTANDDVIIPAGTPDCIVIKTNPAFCKHLFIEKGAKVITNDSAELNIGN